MDKTALINYIKDLHLDRRLENFLVNHIEESEMDQDLLDRVAEMVDIRAEQYKLKGEMFDRLAQEAEELQTRTEESEANFEDEADDLMEKFLDEVEAVSKEDQTTEAVEASSVTESVVPVEPVSAPVAPMAATFEPKVDENKENDWMPKPSPYTGGIGVNPASVGAPKPTPIAETPKPAPEVDMSLQNEINNLAGMNSSTPVQPSAPAMPASPAVVSPATPASTNNGWDASAWYNQNKGSI